VKGVIDKYVLCSSEFYVFIRVCKPAADDQLSVPRQLIFLPGCHTVPYSFQSGIARSQRDHPLTVLQNAGGFCIPQSGR